MEDSCGCAMGARFLAVGMAASAIWYAWHWRDSGLSLGSVTLRVFLWSFLAAGAGKLVGIALYSWRHRRPRLKTVMS
jgi:hypothetical protein